MRFSDKAKRRLIACLLAGLSTALATLFDLPSNL